MNNLLTSRSTKMAIMAGLFGLILSALLAFKILEDQPACAIALSKQNVFYIGVENPVTIVVRGVPTEQLVVTASTGLTIEKLTGDQYMVQAHAPGTGSITVSGGVLEPITFPYRVKRIPDPVPLLGAQYGSCSMGNGEFKAQNGIAMVFKGNFDYDVYCDVIGYALTYFAKKHDPVVAVNSGARYTGQVQALVYRAKPGDLYLFSEIRMRCPGDGEYRDLGSLVFRIK